MIIKKVSQLGLGEARAERRYEAEAYPICLTAYQVKRFSIETI
jgi:hypothetical protein